MTRNTADSQSYIRITCKVADFLPLESIEKFQGNLKKRIITCTWTNQTQPFVIGYHTRQICACIDYAIEKFRQGKSTYWVITVPFRHGKLLSLDTPIFTTSGWKNHGELQPGDYVFGDDGLPHRVIANTGAYE
jgi:hypothetical protein